LILENVVYIYRVYDFIFVLFISDICFVRHCSNKTFWCIFMVKYFLLNVSN